MTQAGTAIRAGLLVMASLLACYGCGRSVAEGDPAKRKPIREIFILPRDYRGPFIAIYEQADGQYPTWRGDSAFVRVPASGVVRLHYAEPPTSTRTSHVHDGRRSGPLPNYPTCADMRVGVADSRVGVCWLDFQVNMGNTPDHIVAVVTDWNGIPANFERTTQVYDSVLLGGKGIGIRSWEEPRNLKSLRANPNSRGGKTGT